MGIPTLKVFVKKNCVQELHHVNILLLKQGYVMEILLTLEAASDWTMVDQSNTSESKNDQDLSLRFYMEDEKDDAVDDYSLHIVSSGPLIRVRQGGHIRSLSSGCEFKRHSGLLHRFGRLNGSRDDPMLRAKRY